MYSYNDFERLFVRYKLEGIPAGVSIEKFYMSNKVLYNLFAKWYKDTRKKIIPVQVLGAPSTEAEMKESPSPIPVSERTRYSSEVTGWHTFQRYIIPSSQYVRCKVCLCLIISRDFSAKLLKDLGIMNIYYP